MSARYQLAMLLLLLDAAQVALQVNPTKVELFCMRPRTFRMELLNRMFFLDFMEELLRLRPCVHLQREEGFDRAGFDCAHRERGQSLQSLSFLHLLTLNSHAAF